MKKFLFVAIVSCILSSNLFAQSVAINSSGATANASSILDVQSTTKGMLIPRMTKAQKNAIVSPATGLLVYQAVPDSVGFHYYSGSQWIWLNPAGAASNDWSLTGNTGTDTAVNFIGTINNMPLAFRVNNEKSGRIESNPATANTFIGNRSGLFAIGDNNTGFGFRSLNNLTTGRSNTAMGIRSLFNVAAGNNNVAIGDSAAFNTTTVSEIVAVGSKALFANTSGIQNTAIGALSLQDNTIGNFNTALGYGSLKNNTSGITNTAIGHGVLTSNTNGIANTGLGAGVLSANTTGAGNLAIGSLTLIANTSGDNNTAIGYRTLESNTIGNNNVAIGFSALQNNTTQGGLIAIGSNALYTNTTGSQLTAVGNNALYANTTGVKNIAIGSSALVNNTTGFQNLAIGVNALLSNITGFANIAIGDSALPVSTTNWNLAIGRYALLETTTGDKNIAIGDVALRSNVTGANNVAIGYASQNSTNTNNRNNTSLGFRSAGSMQGYSNTVIGGDAMGKPAVSYTVTNTVAVGDSVLFNIITGASNNTAVGSKALFNNTTGRSNTAIGVKALYDNTTGNNNVAIGDSAAYNNTTNHTTAIGSKALFTNTTGFTNTAIGSRVLFANTTGSNNTALGYNSLEDNITGSDNVAIGKSALGNMNGSDNVALGNSAGANYSLDPIDNTSSNNIYIGIGAGFNTAGSNNVFIGNNVASNLTTSNKLYIDNSNTTAPLIFGDFATNLLRVNGTLNINNDYSFPTVDGLANQVLHTNGLGAVSWATLTGETTTASNGLTLTGSNVTLGGTLINNTSITHGNFNVQHFLSGTGDFLITTPSNNALSVLSTGNTGINTNAPTHRLHLINDVGGSANNYANGMFIQNNNVTAGQATLAFKNTVLPGNRAWITGMNAFDNYVIAYGDSLSSTNVVLRVDTAGYVGINPVGLPSSRLDVVGSFGNAIRVVSTNQTLSEDDHTIIVATGTGAITITLPAASSCERREYIIVNRTGTDKTISPAYNDFSGTATNAPANASITLQSNGTNWFRIQ